MFGQRKSKVKKEKKKKEEKKKDQTGTQARRRLDTDGSVVTEFKD